MHKDDYVVPLERWSGEQNLGSALKRRTDGFDVSLRYVLDRGPDRGYFWLLGEKRHPQERIHPTDVLSGLLDEAFTEHKTAVKRNHTVVQSVLLNERFAMLVGQDLRGRILQTMANEAIRELHVEIHL